MKQNRNVSYLNQNKTKLNYVIKFSLIECSLFITLFIPYPRVNCLKTIPSRVEHTRGTPPHHPWRKQGLLLSHSYYIPLSVPAYKNV